MDEADRVSDGEPERPAAATRSGTAGPTGGRRQSGDHGAGDHGAGDHGAGDHGAGEDGASDHRSGGDGAGRAAGRGEADGTHEHGSASGGGPTGPGGGSHGGHGEHGRHGGDPPDDGTVPGRRLSRMNPFAIGLVGGLGALTAWALGTLIVQARGVLMLIVVALYLAMGLNPVVEWLHRRRVPRGVGVTAVFVGVLGVVSLIITSVVPVVTQQVAALVEQVPTWFERLEQNRTFREFDAKYNLTERIQEFLTQGELGQQLAGGVIGFGVVVVSAMFALLTVLVLTVYFLGTLPKLLNAVYSLVPRSRRARITYLGNQSVAKIGNYVGGQLLVAGLAGVMSFFFLSIVGLREYAVALAAAVALFDLVPLIGGAISAVTVTSVGFFTDLRIGIACAIYYVIYQQIENYVILPRVMAHAVKVPGTVIVVAALLGGSMFGMVGALLAVPTSAAILMLIREVVIPRQQAT